MGVKPGDIITVPRSAVCRVVKPTDELRAHVGVIRHEGDWTLFSCPDCEALTQARGKIEGSVICSGCKLIFNLADAK